MRRPYQRALFDLVQMGPQSRAGKPANRAPRIKMHRYFERLPLLRCTHAKTVPTSFVRPLSRWVPKNRGANFAAARAIKEAGKREVAASKRTRSLRRIRVRPTPQQAASQCPASRSPLSGASPLADRTGAATMAALRIRPNIGPAAVLMGSVRRGLRPSWTVSGWRDGEGTCDFPKKLRERNVQVNAIPGFSR
jgi:hypothetical protein